MSYKNKILDPRRPFLQRWNKIFFIASVIAVSLDPLFLYIPFIDGQQKCLDLDKKLKITACVLRSFTDIFYILHIFFQFRTGFIASSSRVFGTGELIEDRYAIARGYLSSFFVIDVLAVLPLPQFVVLVTSPLSRITIYMLKVVVLSQYVPRLLRIYPLYQEATRTGLFTERAWAGAAFNFFFYMLASHVVGAFWYVFTIESQDRCWHVACEPNRCSLDELYCGPHRRGVNSVLYNSSPLFELNEIKDSRDFNFGIFLEGLQSGEMGTRNIQQKLFYCHWWGLRNLSSLGQNLRTSAFIWEIVFADLISIIGLVLFLFLIGNMQVLFAAVEDMGSLYYTSSMAPTLQEEAREVLAFSGCI